MVLKDIFARLLGLTLMFPVLVSFYLHVIADWFLSDVEQ